MRVIKNQSKKLAYFALLSGLSFLSACHKNAPVAPNNENLTILQYIAQDTRFTILNAAIKKTHLDTLFSTGGPYTFFAPDDSAFLIAGLNIQTIDTFSDVIQLSNILKYHIVPGKINIQEINGYTTEYPSSLYLGLTPRISKTYYGAFYNGQQVLSADVLVGDGVVERIDQIAYPPQFYLVDMLGRQPELTLFAAVMARIYPSILQTVLNNTDNLGNIVYDTANYNPQVTIFAPDNAAFNQFGYQTIQDINNADSAYLYNLVLPYVVDNLLYIILNGVNQGAVPQPVYSSDLIGGGNFSSYLYSSVDGNYLVSGPSADGEPHPGIQVPVRILRKNILAKSWIIHTVDQVFRP